MMKRVLAAACVLSAGGHALASSHREAPSIARDPAADLTDVYVFASERAGHYAFVLNVSPGYVSYAGPNWYGFDDDVLYELHVDNDGDAIEDVTYQFKFTTNDYRAMENKGLIVSYFPHIVYDEAKGRYVGLEDGAATLGPQGRPALLQTYSVTKVTGGRRSNGRTEIVKDALVAPPRIGPHTTDIGLGFKAGVDKTLAESYAGYKALADRAIKTTTNGSKYFAGPRNDPFYVDLGAVFDRVSPRINLASPPAAGGSVTGVPRDALKGVNVLSIVFEVPNAEIFGAAGNNHIGVWATTSRPQAKILRPDGKADLTGGGYVQVSRLGNPLVNEVVIKVGEKDKFNNTEPKSDVDNFAGYVTDPQLAFVLNVLYGDGQGVAGLEDGLTAGGLITNITGTGRQDLVDVFVAGIKTPGGAFVSRHPNESGTGDMIRVNKALSAGALGIAQDGDGNAIPPGTIIEGWPLNGRVLADDVVNTALTFLSDCKFLAGLNIVRAVKLDLKYDLEPLWANHKVGLPAGTISASNLSPANCLLDDFVTQPDATPGSSSTNGILASFPYIDAPHSSYYDRNTVLSYAYP